MVISIVVISIVVISIVVISIVVISIHSLRVETRERELIILFSALLVTYYIQV